MPLSRAMPARTTRYFDTVACSSTNTCTSTYFGVLERIVTLLVGVPALQASHLERTESRQSQLMTIKNYPFRGGKMERETTQKSGVPMVSQLEDGFRELEVRRDHVQHSTGLHQI